MAILTNIMRVNAEYNDLPIDAQSTVYVEMGSMQLVKTADKSTWLDEDLTYTVTLTNIEDVDTGLPLTDVVFTDTIDPTLTTLITTSVTINGDPATIGTDFTYDAVTGLLTIEYPNNIAPGVEVIIIFRVRKV